MGNSVVRCMARDPRFSDAAELAVDRRYLSLDDIQSGLGVNYMRAVQLMDLLIAAGVINAYKQRGGCAVLMDRGEWLKAGRLKVEGHIQKGNG